MTVMIFDFEVNDSAKFNNLKIILKQKLLNFYYFLNLLLSRNGIFFKHTLLLVKCNFFLISKKVFLL